jgi:hypothetical protein
MAITTDKLATLKQLRTTSERIAKELAKYTKTADLGKLALKDEVSYDELATALKNLIDGKLNAEDGMTKDAISTAISKAVSESGHATFEKADAIPAAADAKENVLYLVMNDTTSHYDIYAKVGTEVVLLDDTTVDLSGYATTQALNDAIASFISLTALSVEATGSGNAVTAVEYDNKTGKFTFTKGATYLTADDVPIATDTEVSNMLTEVFGAETTEG